MTRFIVRVDDVGQSLVQAERDNNLDCFGQWLAAWGLLDEPIYLGVVTGSVGAKEITMLRTLARFTSVVLCLHGHSHTQEFLTEKEIVASINTIPECDHVIPPYNAYNEATLRAWWNCTWPRVTAPVLFGGFDGDHHAYGPAPRVVNGVLHLSAEPALYAHAYRLVDMVDMIDDPGYPVVVTLHHRWDVVNLEGVTKLREKLRGRIVSTAEAWP